MPRDPSNNIPEHMLIWEEMINICEILYRNNIIIGVHLDTSLDNPDSRYTQ